MNICCAATVTAVFLTLGMFSIEKDETGLESPDFAQGDTNPAEPSQPPSKSDSPAAEKAKPDKKQFLPGEVREFEIAAGVKMKFCWIPPGQAQLGSPKEERQRILKSMKPEIADASANYLAEEADDARGKYESKGFWLAKYPVTQNEWQSVMGTNPSSFSKQGKNNDLVMGLDTSRFPVDSVSWDDVGELLKKLNARGGASKVFEEPGKFALPTEDEWEYACRGGLGNGQAFYFGNSLNGKQANCNGNTPFGDAARGIFKRRTTEVGAYESIAPHPWGLCDMHGNVTQWCENCFEKDKNLRAIRGGNWQMLPEFCRADARGFFPADRRPDFCGCRICYRRDQK